MKTSTDLLLLNVSVLIKNSKRMIYVANEINIMYQEIWGFFSILADLIKMIVAPKFFFQF
jgi:hypothetical protein